MDISEITRMAIELEEIRGFTHEGIPEKKECFKEESKEFLDALDGNGDPADEGADVIFTVEMSLRRKGIDLKTALMNKYEKDKMRV